MHKWLRVFVWLMVVKAVVTVWGYANGLSWLEANPWIIVVEGTHDWSIWYIPQLLFSYGGLFVIAPYTAYLFLQDATSWVGNFTKGFTWWWAIFHLWLAAAAPITWAIQLARPGVG